MTLIPLAFGLAAMAATLAGGLLALRLQHRIGLILGITAGIVIGVALFDLVPEAMGLAGDRWSVRSLMIFVAAGLGGYMLLDRALASIPRAEESWRGHLGPAMLCLHSLMDGLGIGLAFQIDTGAGWMIALAVLTHDVADGVNTVSLSLAARSEAAARRWLVVNGIAPMLGVLRGIGIVDRYRAAPQSRFPELAGALGRHPRPGRRQVRKVIAGDDVDDLMDVAPQHRLAAGQ